MSLFKEITIIMLTLGITLWLAVFLFNSLGGIGLLISMPLAVGIGSLTSFLIDYFSE